MQIQLESFEKLILYRNFRAGLKEGESSFTPNHLSTIHQNLCKGLEHKDKSLKSGELRVSSKAVTLLGNESNNIAFNMMGSAEKLYISQRAAYMMQRVEQLQPFHSFNTLVGKLYSNNIAQSAGFRIDWPLIDKQSFKASLEESKSGDYSKLAKIIESNLKPMAELNFSLSVKDHINKGFSDRASSFIASNPSNEVSKSTKLQIM